jgi:hypothetical protein
VKSVVESSVVTGPRLIRGINGIRGETVIVATGASDGFNHGWHGLPRMERGRRLYRHRIAAKKKRPFPNSAAKPVQRFSAPLSGCPFSP